MSIELLRALNENIRENRYTGSYAIFVGSVTIESAMRKDDTLFRIRELNGFISWDLIGIDLIFQRIIWTKNNPSTFPNDHWREYIGLDIEMWFYLVRSILDYVAKIIRESFGRHSPESFSDLRKGCLANKYDDYLPADLIEFIKNCNWFDNFKDTRDSAVHNGAQVVVFGAATDELQFQVHDGRSLRAFIGQPPLMHNGTVVYFKRYAALIMAYLYNLLEAISSIIGDTFHLRPTAATYEAGSLPMLKEWTRELIDVWKDHPQ